MDLELASGDGLSLQQVGLWQDADPWLNTSTSPATWPGGPNMDSNDNSGSAIAPQADQTALPNRTIDPTLPLLEDELLAELADFSLHAWFDDFDGEIPPLLIAPQPVLLSAAQASSAAPSTADTTTAGAGTSGTGVSPVTETTSSAEPTSTFLVSGSFAAVSTETAAGPVIASMTLTRATDWQREGGTATVSVEVYNGTGSAVAAGDYWVSFFVDRGVEGITVPEPTHAVPGLAPGETTDVPSVGAEVVVAAGAERELYHLRAALLTNPNAPPRDPAPLLVESVSDLSIQWTAHTTGGVQAMGGGGQGGGVPHIESLDLAPFSIWTEISGPAFATANVCNNSGAPIIEGQYEVMFSVDLNPMGIEPPDPLPVPGLEDNSCAPVPPWGGTPFDVSWTAVTGTYTARATIPNASTETHPLHVVAVNDWMVEWENPPGSGTWVDPDGALPDGTDYLWTHDTRRWTALGISHPTLVTSIDWLFREAGTTNPWQSFASATGNNPAEGDSLTDGDWEITPDVHFQGQGSAQMPEPKRFVLAKIESMQWDQHKIPDPNDPEKLVVSDEAAQFGRIGSGLSIFPDATSPTGPYRPKADLVLQIGPKVEGITVRFKPFDVDDPSDNDGPIDVDPPACSNPPQPGETDDNGTDNLLDGYNPPVSGTTDEDGKIRETFELLTFHPGNNYRFAAAHRQSELDPIKPLSDNDYGLLFHDLNDNGCKDLSEVVLDETTPPPGVAISEMATVWRWLRLEIDSMEGGPGGGQTHPDDPAIADVPDPDTNGLVPAFRQAFVEVAAGSQYDDGQTPWQHHFNSLQDLDTYIQGERGISNGSPAYWTAYVIGIYEANEPPVGDNDPDGELGSSGTSALAEPEWSAIPMEIIRDLAAQHGWSAAEQEQVVRQVVVHEIGHHFELTDDPSTPPTHVMFSHNSDANEAFLPQVPIEFREDDLKTIRETVMP